MHYCYLKWFECQEFVEVQADNFEDIVPYADSLRDL
jgi:hypothetical protein